MLIALGFSRDAEDCIDVLFQQFYYYYLFISNEVIKAAAKVNFGCRKATLFGWVSRRALLLSGTSNS